MHLHLEMARQLRAIYPDVPIVFATFFEWAAKQVRRAGYDLVYLPTALCKADLEGVDHKIAATDRELFETYGVGLNLLLHSERFLPTASGTAEDFLKRHVSVLDSLVEDGTLSISSMYDHFMYWLGGSLANIRNGAHFAFVGTAVPGGRVLALKTPWEPWYGRNPPDAGDLLETAKQQMQLPVEQRIEYMRKSSGRDDGERLTRFGEMTRAAATDRRKGSYFAQRSMVHEHIHRMLRQRVGSGFRPNYDIEAFDKAKGLTGSYYYAPLHMEPEATILMYSPWLRCQIEMCRLCSQALPPGSMLMVKENPKMNRKRPRLFYKALRSLPGVRLVAPEVDSTKLIEASSGVVTLAGSAALEAAIMGKPSLVFGRPPFRKLLTDSDLLADGGCSLRRLDSWMRGPNTQSLRSMETEWNNWVSATFKASNAPRMEGGVRKVDSSMDNAARHVEFIGQRLIENTIKR